MLQSLESRVGQKMAFNLEISFDLWSIAVCVYPIDFGLMVCDSSWESGFP